MNIYIWVWRSLVARLNGVQEVAGSIPVTQTIYESLKPVIRMDSRLFCFCGKYLISVCYSVIRSSYLI